MEMHQPNEGSEYRLPDDELVQIVQESDWGWPEPSNSDLVPMDEIAAVRLYLKKIGIAPDLIDALLAETENDTMSDIDPERRAA